MRVLLDTCVHSAARPVLEAAGHDVAAVADLPSDPGDEAILAQAAAEKRVLVTLDKDFGELAVLHRQSHAGIVRLVDARADEQGPRCAAVLRLHEADLVNGAIVTAERLRTRIRPAD